MKNSLITRMKMVSDILAKHDPMHLIATGAPVDEYDNEAVLIVQKLQEEGKINETDAAYWCGEIFNEQFGHEIAYTIIWDDISREIFEACQ